MDLVDIIMIMNNGFSGYNYDYEQWITSCLFDIIMNTNNELLVVYWI